MPDFTSQDREAAARAVAAAMVTDTGPEPVMALAAGIDPKQLFCQNWDTVKTVLEVLKALVPGPVGVIIGVVIKAGDAAHKAICK